ncbi:glycosyltransferase [Vacuolonema iberomarrocanum]|uniref:glycosyltransferase n=1 Tax=Vacuolonema iberomarrocanum TaxID=3454632 RepID=UPI0019DA6B79|nr:glycosyltransferase [filamentous cyanobacterium LEGE 07170]
MQLSVIIACLNAEDTIGIQLSALQHQVWNKSWEILIVDNGCTDRTLEIVESYQTQLPNLRVVDASDKKGAGHARNIGVREAKGELILFCDSDDKVHDGWVAKMGDALESFDFIAGALNLQDLNAGWRIPKNHPLGSRTAPQQQLPRYRHARELKYAPTANLGVRKSIHSTIGGFDEDLIYNQDLEYCLRTQLAGYPLHFVPDAIVEYRLKHSLRKTFIQFYRWGRYGILVYRRHIGKGSLVDRLRFIFGGWRHLPLQIIKVRNKADVFELCAWLGGRFGEIVGCWEFLIMQPETKLSKNLSGAVKSN